MSPRLRLPSKLALALPLSDLGALGLPNELTFIVIQIMIIPNKILR